MTINYTIIIPHKDIPDLLQHCLDSIPQRADLQVIVVDDNSDLAKVNFTHFPGLDRPDVECFFTREGRGAGYARNVGLEHAKGKWLLFADADDFFHDGMLDMLDKWKDSDNDIVYFKLDSLDLSSGKQGNRDKAANYILDLYTNGLIDMRSCCAQMVRPSGKMLNHKFVVDNNLAYQELPYANDIAFAAMSSLCVNKISISHEVLYIITTRTNSLTRLVSLSKSCERMKVNLCELNRLNTYFRDNNYPSLQYEVCDWALRFSLGTGLSKIKAIALFFYTVLLLVRYNVQNPIIKPYQYSLARFVYGIVVEYISFYLKRKMRNISNQIYTVYANRNNRKN